MGFDHGSSHIGQCPYARGFLEFVEASDPSTDSGGVEGKEGSEEEEEMLSSSQSLSSFPSTFPRSPSLFSSSTPAPVRLLFSFRPVDPLSAGRSIPGGGTLTRSPGLDSSACEALGEFGEYHHCENLRARRVRGKRFDRACRGKEANRLVVVEEGWWNYCRTN